MILLEKPQGNEIQEKDSNHTKAVAWEDEQS